MSSFSSATIENQLNRLRVFYPGFPVAQVSLIRQAKLLVKRLQEQSNTKLKPYQLTYVEYNLLIIIAIHGQHGCSPSHLITATGERSANITRLVNVLCNKGLLERGGDVEDRRRVALRLTPEGEQLLSRLWSSIDELVRQQLGGFSEAELATLASLMSRWYEQLD